MGLTKTNGTQWPAKLVLWLIHPKRGVNGADTQMGVSWLWLKIADWLSFDWEYDEKPVDVVCQYSDKPTHLTNKNPDVYQS